MTTTHPHPAAHPGTVSTISLPPRARALSTLPRIDYEDAFRVDAGVQRTPEQWLTAVIGDAPLRVRARLVTGWLALGLKLGPSPATRRTLGWKVQHSDPSYVLLAADSWQGLHGQLLLRSEPGGVLFATLIQLTNPGARAIWARITPTHQDIVQSLLSHAARREAGRLDHAREAAQPAPARLLADRCG
jgi:hypothetical protein